MNAGRRQGVCFIGRAKCLPTAVPALKCCASAEKVAERMVGGGGGGGGTPTHFFFRFQKIFPKIIIMG